MRVDLFDIETRTRMPWREFQAFDPSGASIIYQPVIARDGEVYFYSLIRRLENLFLVEGLR